MTIVRLGAAVALILLLTGCDNQARAYPVPTAGQRWGDYNEMAYLSSCENKGASASYCRCTLNYFESNESLAEMEPDLMYHLRTGEYPTSWKSAVSVCGGSVPS